MWQTSTHHIGQCLLIHHRSSPAHQCSRGRLVTNTQMTCCNSQSWQPPWNFALSNKSSVTATASLRATSVLCNRRRDMMVHTVEMYGCDTPAYAIPAAVRQPHPTAHLWPRHPTSRAHTRLLTHAASGSHTTVGCHSHSLPADASRSTLRRCNASQQQLILSTLVCRPHRRSKTLAALDDK